MWQQIATPRYNWPTLRPEQVYCVMACAYAMGLPGALAEAAPALGIHVLKDNEGHGLMLRLARPRRTEGDRHIWWSDPDKLTRLFEYSRQDVRVERELHKRLMPLSHKERKVWLLDYAINQRGVAVDVETAKAAVKMSEVVKEQANAEISEITHGEVQSFNALLALKGWLAKQGCVVDGLAKADIVSLLESDDSGLGPAARRVLTLRQEAGKASTAKLTPMLDRAGPDNRLRSVVQYHGAATGRWAGRGVQVHNLPREVPPAKAVEKIFGLIREGRHDIIDAIYGPPLSVLSRCLRGFFVAPPGKVLVAGDFANVEGRAVAWFSGEQWKLRAFAETDAGTGPGLYELAYAKAFHVPVESIKNPSFERQVGKTMELTFGFQGGKGAFRTMGRLMGVDVDDDQAEEFKVPWRAAHPRTVKTWYDLQDAAIAAVRNPGQTFEAGYPGRQVRFKTAGSFLWMRLPSGRYLCYPYPKILENQYGPQLTYMTVPTPDDKKKGKVIDDVSNSAKWARVTAYGGSLMQNVAEGVCRDLLVDCMLDMGNFVVLHVHDEIVLEVPEARGEQARAKMQEIMRTPPEWAKGFPLWATCSVMRRYGGK
jgi:DNA polymerase